MYKIPLETWVVIANTCKATIYESSSTLPSLKILKEIEFPHVHSRDISHDRPGKVFESASPTHHAYPDSIESWHQKEIVEMAHSIVDFLKSGEEKKHFKHLIIVAPDNLLTQIRKKIPAALQPCVLKEIPKDLTHIHPNELVERLVD